MNWLLDAIFGQRPVIELYPYPRESWSLQKDGTVLRTVQASENARTESFVMRLRKPGEDDEKFSKIPNGRNRMRRERSKGVLA